MPLSAIAWLRTPLYAHGQQPALPPAIYKTVRIALQHGGMIVERIYRTCIEFQGEPAAIEHLFDIGLQQHNGRYPPQTIELDPTEQASTLAIYIERITL